MAKSTVEIKKYYRKGKPYYQINQYPGRSRYSTDQNKVYNFIAWCKKEGVKVIEHNIF